MESALEFLKTKIHLPPGERNPFTIRGISKKTGISPGAISEIFGGRRSLTKKTALRICEGLNLSLTERVTLLKYFGEGIDQPVFQPIDSGHNVTENYNALIENQYKLISSWEHYAILSLIDTKDFNPDPNWIAKRLGIDLSQCYRALERLRDLGIIERTKTGYIIKRRKLTTSEGIPSETIRNAHRNSYILANAALNNVPMELRDMSAMTICFNKSKIRRAKKLLQNFRRDFALLMEQEKGDEVYHLQLSFFPLSRSIE